MIDIVIFAVVAVFLLARLWAVLGERHDDEPKGRNPFTPRPRQDQDEDDFVLRPSPRAENPMEDSEGRIQRLNAAPPPQSLAGGIEAIRQRDPSFDEKQFLQGAKAAFAMIVESFAKGEMNAIERFLAPAVAAGFKNAIATRQAEGPKVAVKVKGVQDAAVIAARVEGTRAFLTVSFTSLQTDLTFVEHIEEVHDTWTFARDMTSSDPNWQLVETKA